MDALGATMGGVLMQDQADSLQALAFMIMYLNHYKGTI